MSWLTDLLGVYGRVFARAIDLLATNWLLAVMVIAYQAIMLGAGLALMPLGVMGGTAGGLVGSIVAMLVWAACVSSFLAVLGRVIRDGRVTPREVPGSFTLHLGDVLNVGFLLFGLQLLGRLVLVPFPYLYIVFGIAVLVFLNAVPEMLYLGNIAGPALFVESYRFIGRYWIEWFPPTLLLAAVSLGALAAIPGGVFAVLGWAVAAVAVTFLFLVRGLLFLELTTSSRRAREFQRRSVG